MIYFVQAGVRGPVKIGKTGNLTARLSALATGHYEPMVVLATLDVPDGVERKLHRLLDAHRVRGEWFAWCPEIERVVRLAKSGQLPDLPPDPARVIKGEDCVFDDAKDTLADMRRFIARNGYVRVATKAGLAKATLLRFREPSWNPRWSTIAAVSAVMDASDEAA